MRTLAIIAAMLPVAASAEPDPIVQSFSASSADLPGHDPIISGVVSRDPGYSYTASMERLLFMDDAKPQSLRSVISLNSPMQASILGGTEARSLSSVEITWPIGGGLTFTGGGSLWPTVGPAVSFTYGIANGVTVGLATVYEDARLRTDSSARVPVPADERASLPVVVTFTYTANPLFRLSIFAGADFGLALQSGDRESYSAGADADDTRSILGATALFRF